MVESRLGVAENNTQQEQRAVAMLYELIQQALSGRMKATMVQIRLPIHGLKLGQPKGCIERE